MWWKMTNTRPTGVLEGTIWEAVEAAMKQAVAEHIAPAIAELQRQAVASGPSVPADAKTERFVSMAEMCTRLGINRTTVIRREKMGKIPKRRDIAGHHGWSSLDVDALFNMPASSPDVEANARLASRIKRQH